MAIWSHCSGPYQGYIPNSRVMLIYSWDQFAYLTCSKSPIFPKLQEESAAITVSSSGKAKEGSMNVLTWLKSPSWGAIMLGSQTAYPNHNTYTAQMHPALLHYPLCACSRIWAHCQGVKAINFSVQSASSPSLYLWCQPWAIDSW